MEPRALKYLSIRIQYGLAYTFIIITVYKASCVLSAHWVIWCFTEWLIIKQQLQLVGILIYAHNKHKLPCSVNWKMWFLFWFSCSIQQWVYIGTPVNKAWLWNRRKMAGLKQTKEKWEWVGLMGSYSPSWGTFWFKAVNQLPPFLKDTHTHTCTVVILCWRPDAPGGIQATLKTYDPKSRGGRERKNPDVSLPLPQSLPNRLVGCLKAVDVCALLWLVPDVLHWPKSPRQ